MSDHYKIELDDTCCDPAECPCSRVEKAVLDNLNFKKSAAEYFETCPDGHVIWSEWIYDKKNAKD